MAWNYAELSQMAKAFGGPEMLVKHLTRRGIEIGIKQAEGKYGLMVGLGVAGGSFLTALAFLVVNHFKKEKAPIVSGDEAEQLLINGIKAYDEKVKNNPDMETLPEISRKEAEARIEQYVQDVSDDLKMGKNEPAITGEDRIPKAE